MAGIGKECEEVNVRMASHSQRLDKETETIIKTVYSKTLYGSPSNTTRWNFSRGPFPLSETFLV